MRSSLSRRTRPPRARRLAAILCGALLLAGPAAAEKVKVSYPDLTGSLLFLFTALDKGYYTAEGIEPELIEAGGGVATPALMSGDLGFSTSGSTAISAILKGAKLKVLLVGQDRPDWQLWATKPEIKRFEDLKGQQVGIISRGDTGEIALRYVLKTRHLPDDFIAFTPFGSAQSARLATIASGALPASLIHPADVDMLKAMGALKNAHLLLDTAETVRSTFNGLATSDALIQSKPDLVLRFVRATMKGMDYTRRNRDASIERFVRDLKATPDGAVQGYDQLRPLMAESATISPEARATEVALRGDMLSMAADKVPPATTVFDFSFAEKVAAQLKSEGWIPTP
jgi:ABC-type nitrate/sulfonate/bicarbonate transport system substrate-binding protein